MTALRKKIDNGLNEARILILGTEVLLGMNFRAAFQSSFQELTRAQQLAKTAGLTLLLGTLILLILPASFHRLVESGNDTMRLHRVIGAAVEAALFLLAGAIGLETAVAVGRAFGRRAGFVAGSGMVVTALTFWWILEIGARRLHPAASREKDRMTHRKAIHETGIDERVENVLTEARLILPGAQALLGFQLGSMLLKEFGELPPSSRVVHLSASCAVTLATILLMAPSAFHRIVERGENDERFQRLAGRFVVAAMIPLALGICADFFVVLRRVGTGVALATALSAAALALFYGVWFAAPLLYRRVKGGFEKYR